MMSASEALARLRWGNERFAEDRSRPRDPRAGSDARRRLLAGQHPFAIVLGCSDARVPAEIVFDQSIGDLFVIRVAGNIVAPEQIGSVEFAALTCGTPITVVLGHTRCGAVQATVGDLQQPAERSENLQAIVRHVRPAVDRLIADGADPAGEDFVERAVEANVRESVALLRERSDVLRELIERGVHDVVGGVYSLETGRVRFLDDE